LYWGKTKWHPEEQWLLEADDLVKNTSRTFAMKYIQLWTKNEVDCENYINNKIKD